MPEFSRIHVALLVVIASVVSLMIPGELQAGCERCTNPVFTGGMSWCVEVKQEETGVTLCKDGVDLFGPYCSEDGIYCSVVDAGGGGGTGSGGGGTNPCQTSGFCPAQCFSCSGGGRPAI